MDYKAVLRIQLLSQQNIDFLVNKILTNFRINAKAGTKCVSLITKYMTSYLENIARYPENADELLDAISFLNKKCYDDFAGYLSAKYPNENILRENIIGDNILRENSLNNIQLEPVKQLNRALNTIPHQTLNTTPSQYSEIIIISEEEKNELLKKYSDNNPKTNPDPVPVTVTNKSPDDFLAYLTNPLVLQMFNMMANQASLAPSVQKIPPQKSSIVFDEILDTNQVHKLLNESQSTSTISKSATTKTKKPVNKSKPKKSKKTSVVEVAEETAEVAEADEEDIVIDLDNLTPDVLPFIEKRLQEIILLKDKYIAEKNKAMVKELEKEKYEIITALKNQKKKFQSEAKETENKIHGMTMSYSKRSEEGDNVEFLDLKFDPTNDYNDLKNIVIGFKTDNKITDITLLNYYLPFNSNNVTRFNNKFMVHFNGRVNKVVIPAGKYEINILLDYIKSQANFLDFTINESNIITIKNTLNMKFDLMIDKDSIFPLLGFTGKIDNYKEKIFYSGAHAYDIKCNETVFFVLSGSTMDPLSLEFDREVFYDKSLKRSRAGSPMRQMALNFTNTLGQFYDFILPFKMCFRITYLE